MCVRVIDVSACVLAGDASGNMHLQNLQGLAALANASANPGTSLLDPHIYGKHTSHHTHPCLRPLPCRLGSLPFSCSFGSLGHSSRRSVQYLLRLHYSQIRFHESNSCFLGQISISAPVSKSSWELTTINYAS